MSWTKYHDPVGVLDYPEEWKKSYPGELRILNYWTNEAGIRIGFFGHAKGIATFTYKNGDINFLFNVIPGQDPERQLDNADRTLGPTCRVFIKERHPAHLGSKYGQEEINNIRDFMFIYKDPRFPSPVAIKTVLFNQPDEYYCHSYVETPNA